MPRIKTIRRRASRKPTGKWAEAIRDLRGRIEGHKADGNPRLTQPAFAELLQMSAQTLSRWERGDQDPPPRAREMLALVAFNLGLGRDLELAFKPQSDRAKDIRPQDRAIIGLLRCLLELQAAELAMWTQQRKSELYSAAKTIFETARAVAADALALESSMTPASQMLVAEVTRLVKEIRKAESSFPGLLSRATGMPVYTDVEVQLGAQDDRPLRQMKEIRRRQAEREAGEPQQTGREWGEE